MNDETLESRFKQFNVLLPLLPPSTLDVSSSSASTIEELIDWRVRDRTRTVAAGLLLCLHLGVDPPDVWKPSPCAKWECWVDTGNGRLIQRIGPLSSDDNTTDHHATLHLKSPQPQQPVTDSNPEKTRDTIARNLLLQYEHWQPRVRYKTLLDPTVEDLRKLCSSLRKSAKHERVLVHYNGHGVPRPTRNGELWVFNKQFTQYIPVNVVDICAWVGFPAIWILDCPAAAFILHALQKQNPLDVCNTLLQSSTTTTTTNSKFSINDDPLESFQSDTIGSSVQSHLISSSSSPLNLIVFSASDSHESLPLTPILPADILTSCLTTPLDMALRWHCYIGGPLLPQSLSLDVALKIPGKLSDRRTPLGELNWIFTAITDTIAWLVLPRDLFRKLYRQDLLVASLSRNFLLAQRILKSLYCTASSIPSLPPTHQHSLWTLWDHALDTLLAQLPHTNNSSDTATSLAQSTFFPDQLDAFELWLKHHRNFPPEQITGPPDQLPSALQILLSQNLRPRALRLFAEFCDFGPWACLECLHVGIHPYILKLLQQQASLKSGGSGDNSSAATAAATSSSSKSTNTCSITLSLLHIWTRLISVDSSCKNDLIKDSTFLFFVNSYSAEPIASIIALLAFSLDNPSGRESLLQHQSARDLLQRNALHISDSKLISDDSNDLLWRLLLFSQFPLEIAKIDFIRLFTDSTCSEIRAAVLVSFSGDPQHETELFQMALNDPAPLVRLELLNRIISSSCHPNILKSLQVDPFEPIRLRALEGSSIKLNFVSHCLYYKLPALNRDNESPLVIRENNLELKKHRALNLAEVDLWLERPFSFRKFDQQTALLEANLPISRIHFHPYKPHIYLLDSSNTLRLWDWERDPSLEVDSLPTLKLTETCVNEVSSFIPFSSPGRDDLDLVISCTDSGIVRIDPSNLESSSLSPLSAFSCHDRNVLLLPGHEDSNEIFLLGDSIISRYNILHQTIKSVPRCSTDNNQTCSAALILNDWLVCGTVSGVIEIYNISPAIQGTTTHTVPAIANNPIIHLWAHTTESFFSAGAEGSIRLHRLMPEFKCESIPIWNGTPPAQFTTFASHPLLPNLLAFGTLEHCIKVAEIAESNWDVSTSSGNSHNALTPFQSIKYHDGFLGQRLGNINRLALHPGRIVMAAVTADSFLSIYSLRTEKNVIL